MSNENFFFLNVFGEIKSAEFPLGPSGSGIFIRYDVVAGDDWEILSGVKSGITQCANSGKNSEEIVFNMPIEFTFKSTNIHGCELSKLCIF
jgi:B9 domain-containing protein 1